jgi:hypothetical protein
MAKDKKSKKSKKNTSLRLEGDMLKALKHRAIEEDTSVQRIVERLIEAYLQETDGRKRRGKNDES